MAMNVGFAIPINVARQIADQIRKSGRVARGFLGVSGEDFTAERAAEMHVPFAPGALINAVGRGTPAAAAGLRPNDVVTECAGKSIDGYRRLVALIALLRPGEKAKLVLQRQGQRVETVVTLSASGPGAGADSVLGVELRPLDPRESAALGLGAGEGLAVTAVDPRGPASGVLEEGDILLALDNRGITLARLKARGRAPAAGRARDAADPARAGSLRASPVDSARCPTTTALARGFARCRRSRHRARCRARAPGCSTPRPTRRRRSTAGRRWRCIWDSGWLAPLRRPSHRDGARRPPAAARAGVPPAGARRVHARCAPATARSTSAAVARRFPVTASDARSGAPRRATIRPGRVLIEEGQDFLLSIDGGEVYVLSNGRTSGERRAAARRRRGVGVRFRRRGSRSVGLAPALHGRGGVAARDQVRLELPLLLTHVVR